MSKKDEFIKYAEMAFEAYPTPMPSEVAFYWEAFKGATEEEKPMFTENGKLILKFLQEHPETSMWKARDIAEGLFINSHGVSGAMRKLITDEFVEKLGQNPVVYSITEKGKNIEIN